MMQILMKSMTERFSRNMKKKLLAIVLAAMVCSSFVACGSTESNDQEVTKEEDTEVSVEKEATEEADTEPVEEAQEEETVEEDYSEDFAAALADAEIYGNSDGTSYDDWKDAYKNTINKFIKESPQYDFSYALIYLNNDDVPELLMNTDDEVIGAYLLTYNKNDGTVNVSSTGSTTFTYLPEENVLNATGYVLGAEYVNLISIRDGQWVQLGYGEQGTLDPWAEDSFDENGDVIVNSWTWNGEELGSEEAFSEKFLTYYNYGTAEVVDEYYTKDEILSQIADL